MATIEDLDFTSLTDMSTDEAIEHLRQIRLSRRTPVKPKKTTKKTAKAAKKETPNLNSEQAKKLLKLIIMEIAMNRSNLETEMLAQGQRYLIFLVFMSILNAAVLVATFAYATREDRIKIEVVYPKTQTVSKAKPVPLIVPGDF